MISKYFFPFHRLPFYSVVDFCFCCLCLWCHIPKVIAKTNVKEISHYIFFQEFYSFRSYISVSNPFQSNFCEWCKIGVQFHSFACVYPVFPAPLINETIIFPSSILGSLVKHQLPICVWACIWVLSSVPLVYVFNATTMLL